MAKKRKKSGFLAEFKNFITRGNIMDLAVGLIIGTAFTSIVKSLTNDVIMPLVGAFLGGVDFTGLRIPLWNAEPIMVNNVIQYDQYGQVLYESAIYYGRFIQAIFDFILIALVIFILIKFLNLFHERARLAKERLFEKEAKEKEVVTPPAPIISEDILLLREIRDLLKED